MISVLFYLLYVAGRDFVGRNEVVQMASGERKCWKITILDDSNTIDVEMFYVYLQPIYASFGRTYARVLITDTDRGRSTYV